MSERIQRRHATTPQHHPEEAPTLQRTTATETATDAQSLDALLDEIDTVLESDAEEYVRGFVQKGGQ